MRVRPAASDLAASERVQQRSQSCHGNRLTIQLPTHVAPTGERAPMKPCLSESWFMQACRKVTVVMKRVITSLFFPSVLNFSLRRLKQIESCVLININHS